MQQANGDNLLKLGFEVEHIVTERVGSTQS
jgi:hypothetical protein